MTTQLDFARRRPGRLLRRQAGMSFLAWVTVLAVAAIFASVGLKTIPHYLENRTILEVIESVHKELPDSGSKKKMYELVDKRLKINNVRAYTGKDILEFKRTKEASYWILDYEVRENVVSNMDLVLAFNKEFH